MAQSMVQQKAEWDENMRVGDPNRVENNRAVQVPKQTLGQPPHMLMTGMPRNPNTRHVDVRMGGGSDAEKKKIRAALENGTRRFHARGWVPAQL